MIRSIVLLILIAAAGTAAAEERPAVEYFGADPATIAAIQSRGSRPPFSAAVRVNDILYLSGQIGVRADGTLPEGIEAQGRQVMDNIGAVLEHAGLGFGDVFHCTVMIDDMSQWQTFNQIYSTYFKPDRLPARSALGADGLALGALVEVECEAYAGSGKR